MLAALIAVLALATFAAFAESAAELFEAIAGGVEPLTGKAARTGSSLIGSIPAAARHAAARGIGTTAHRTHAAHDLAAHRALHLHAHLHAHADPGRHSLVAGTAGARTLLAATLLAGALLPWPLLSRALLAGALLFGALLIGASRAATLLAAILRRPATLAAFALRRSILRPTLRTEFIEAAAGFVEPGLGLFHARAHALEHLVAVRRRIAIARRSLLTLDGRAGATLGRDIVLGDQGRGCCTEDHQQAGKSSSHGVHSSSGNSFGRLCRVVFESRRHERVGPNAVHSSQPTVRHLPSRRSIRLRVKLDRAECRIPRRRPAATATFDRARRGG
ncbi:MAG: hypothetical protein HZB39_12230 [Planctomycetes bacterium]|nr:hypothetical protein [Planctomycetota bacterium]